MAEIQSDLLAAPNPENPVGCLANIEIERKIGRGQFSEVFKAKSLRDSSVVALKKVKVCLSVKQYEHSLVLYCYCLFFKHDIQLLL